MLARTAAFLLFAGLSIGSESSRADVLSSLLACRDIADAGARLACFDRESGALASAPAAAPGSTVAGAPVGAAPLATPPPLPDPKQQFGLPERQIAKQEVAAGTRPPEATKIQGRVVGLALTGDKRTVVTLDNDQVWRQLSADTDLFLKLGDTVTISRAVLGSYWLATPTKRGSKVTRVQ